MVSQAYALQPGGLHENHGKRRKPGNLCVTPEKALSATRGLASGGLGTRQQGVESWIRGNYGRAPECQPEIFLIYFDVFRCGDIPHNARLKLQTRPLAAQSLLIQKRAPTCRRHPSETQPNASPWLCNSVQAKTIPE